LSSLTQDWIALDFINWRATLELSQQQAADILDYSSRTIINWERDDRGPIKRRVMLACRYVAENPEIIPHLLRPRPAGLENEVARDKND
jgi:DNA-binding XRE family transcriptional regulator